MVSRIFGWAALMAGVSLGAFGVAAAQSAPPADATPAAEAAGSEDVVVTARKRSEVLRKVPVAATAYSGVQLEEKGIRSALDLNRDTPSLQTSQSLQANSSVQFTLRGQTAGEIQLTFDQPVGVYVDGINYPRVYGLSAGFVDIARVEVLKGPQGTLYGRNTTGGAINIISKAPDYDGEHGYVFAELGDYNSRRFAGAVNTVIEPDKLALRVAFQNWTRDGYGESRITGQDVGGDKNQTFIRGSLLWDVSDKVSVDLKADWLRVRENGYLGTARFYPATTTTEQQVAIDLGLDPFLPASLLTARARLQEIVALGTSDFFTADYNDVLFDNVDQHSVGLTVNYDISDTLSLKSITGYRYLTSDRQIDLDVSRFNLLLYGAESPGPNYFPHFDLTEDALYTQEFNLSGEAWSGRVKWLVGLFYSYEDGDDSSTNNLRAGQVRVVQNNPYTINLTRVVDITSESWSLFTQNDWQITDQLSLTAGLRYTNEKKGLTQKNSRFAPSTGLYQCNTSTTAIVANPDSCAVTREAEFDGWSWLLSLNYQITDDVLVYGKASQGFKGGGFDTRLIGPAFQPEEARDFELGLKGVFFDGALRLNLAAYQTNYTNKQETSIVPVGNLNITVTTNAAEATIRGFEADFSAQLTSEFSVGGTLAYLDGTYDSYPRALNTLNQIVDASGEPFPNPPWTYSVNARYEVPLDDGSISLQADWAWTQGRRPTPRLVDQVLPVALVDELVRADHGLLNLRADYNIDSAGLTFSAFVTNALNEEYQILGSTRAGTGGLQGGITQPPRMFGISIRKSFGSE